jgi:nicotinamidase-related amidase
LPVDSVAVHGWQIAEREYARHEARRGRRCAYEVIDPTRTALVVVDMVRFFVEQSPYARGVVRRINEVAAALRSAGGLVAWVVPRTGEATPWQTGFYGEQVAALYAASGGADDLVERVAPQLAVAEGDPIVEKTAHSALFPGRSPLPDLLEAHGVESVVVAGTVTSVCCESTARDASTLGYQVIVVADGCADVDDAAHNAALRTIYRSFGDVRPTAEVVALVAGSV